VIWCTGYNAGFSWINLPIFGNDGLPVHDRGVVASERGLYFVGLHYLYSMTSATVMGIGRDAKHIARTIDLQTRASKNRDGKGYRLAQVMQQSKP
jgi:putative flavoprotein involved in K+ transport